MIGELKAELKSIIIGSQILLKTEMHSLNNTNTGVDNQLKQNTFRNNIVFIWGTKPKKRKELLFE